MVYGLDSLCLPLDSLQMPASLLLDLLVAAVPRPPGEPRRASQPRHDPRRRAQPDDDAELPPNWNVSVDKNG